MNKIGKFSLCLFLIFSIILITASIGNAEKSISKSGTEFKLKYPSDGGIVQSNFPSFEWDRPKKIEKQKIQVFENIQGKRVIETPPEKIDNPKIKNTFELWKEMIEQADNSILIETKYIRYYRYSNEINTEYMELVEALQTSAVEGVEIKVLSPDSDEEIRKFSQHPRISLKESVDTHSKLLIVDTENMYLGSANWSGTGTVKKNREIGLHFSNEQIVRTYRKIFSTGWKKAGGSEIRNAALESPGKAVPTGRGAGMLEEVKSISQAELELIEKAENKVSGYYYHFSNSRALDDYERALMEAAERGVQIELLFDEISEERRVRLTHENIQIREINLGGFRHSHPKILIVDNRKAHICSANWTSGSHTGKGREIGAVIEYQKLVGTLSHLFYTDWNSEYIVGREESESYKIDRVCKNRPLVEESLNPEKSSYKIKKRLSEGDYYWKMMGTSQGEEIVSGPESFQIRKDENESLTWMKIILLGVILTTVVFLIYWKVSS